jgi:hypothetical protein
MKLLLAGSLLAFSLPALGCFQPPAEQRTAPDELISRTNNIVLARVIAAKDVHDSYGVSYTFKTVRTLKGKAPSQFQISGHPAIWEGENRRFNDHSDKEFWSNGVGRSLNDTDCQIHPTFAVGGTYLVFLDQPYHVKSFEIIVRTNGNADVRDKWLQYVDSRTGP